MKKIDFHFLTLFILEINSLIDTGRYDKITVKEIEESIENGTLFEFLKEKAKKDIDLTIFENGSTYGNSKDTFIELLQNLYVGYVGNERKKWGIENRGLCLLIAWTNEIIQQGKNWIPAN